MLKCDIDKGAGAVSFSGPPAGVAADVMTMLTLMMHTAEQQGVLQELLLHLIGAICSEDNPVARRYGELFPEQVYS